MGTPVLYFCTSFTLIRPSRETDFDYCPVLDEPPPAAWIDVRLFWIPPTSFIYVFLMFILGTLAPAVPNPLIEGIGLARSPFVRTDLLTCSLLFEAVVVVACSPPPAPPFAPLLTLPYPLFAAFYWC